MSDRPYVQFYTSDFLAGTGGLTASTKGVYITLLCLMYETEAPLGQSWDGLARRCGCTLPAFKKAVAELEADGKVTVQDGALWSEKCEKHIASRRERQRGAKAAADARWEKTKQNQRKPDAGAMRAECYSEPEPDKKKEEPNGSSKKGSRLPADWQLPRDWAEWAFSQGMDELSARREGERFRDHWVSAPGQRGVKLDWQATWRNWVRKWLDDRTGRGPPPGTAPRPRIRAQLPEEYR